MKRSYYTLVIVLFLTTLPTHAQTLDADFEALLRYETGADAAPLERIDAAVVASHADRAERRALAEQLTNVLSSLGTSDAAKWFCARQLYKIASNDDVAALAPLLRRSDTSDMARYVVERVPGYAATQVLLDAMRATSGKTRVGIINSLGERGDVSAVQPLRRISGNGDPNVMRAAIVAMGKIGGEDAAAATRWCSENIRRDLRPVATEAYLRCADKFLAEGNRELAARMYDRIYIPAEADYLRMAALRGLLQAEPERAPDLIVETLLHEDDAMRDVAAQSINVIQDESGIAALAGALPGLPAKYQVLVLDALAQHAYPIGLNATLAAARHRDEQVRTAAIGALSAYGDADTINTLIRLAGSPDASVQNAARASLVRIDTPGANDRIIQAAMSADNVIRAEALRAIAARGAEEALPIVLRACEREVGGIRVLAIESLGNIATEKELPLLVKEFTRGRTEDERNAARGAIVATARRLEPGERRIQPIARAITNGRSLENDIALINVLGEIGDDAALPTLKSAATKKNNSLREAAIRTLGKWQSPAALDVLDDVLKKSKSPAEQQLAIDAYLRLIRLESDRTIEETLALYQSLTQRPLTAAQKKLLLAGLAELDYALALALVQPYVDDPEVAAEAKLALDKLGAAE